MAALALAAGIAACPAAAGTEGQLPEVDPTPAVDDTAQGVSADAGLTTTAAMNMPAWAEITEAPRPRRRVPPTCSGDGRYCIAPIAYTRDVCRTIEASASEAELDPGFFARLIWQESLFDAYAISPAGALGIAQFIPSTAKLRGLKDPFNPAAALQASAQYLDYLRDTFGSLGMAAIAYNGGEQRAANFAAHHSGLMPETRAYVQIITGLSAEAWRDSAPASLDLALDPQKPFLDACVDMAANGRAGKTNAPGWLMIYAADPDRSIAEKRAENALAKFPAVFGEHGLEMHQTKLPGKSQGYYVASVEHPTENAARRQCTRLRQAGGGCMVLRE
jgi:hypothetical protein